MSNRFQNVPQNHMHHNIPANSNIDDEEEDFNEEDNGEERCGAYQHNIAHDRYARRRYADRMANQKAVRTLREHGLDVAHIKVQHRGDSLSSIHECRLYGKLCRREALQKERVHSHRISEDDVTFAELYAEAEAREAEERRQQEEEAREREIRHENIVASCTAQLDFYLFFLRNECNPEEYSDILENLVDRHS